MPVRILRNFLQQTEREKQHSSRELDPIVFEMKLDHSRNKAQRIAHAEQTEQTNRDIDGAEDKTKQPARAGATAERDVEHDQTRHDVRAVVSEGGMRGVVTARHPEECPNAKGDEESAKNDKSYFAHMVTRHETGPAQCVPLPAPPNESAKRLDKEASTLGSRAFKLQFATRVSFCARCACAISSAL